MAPLMVSPQFRQMSTEMLDSESAVMFYSLTCGSLSCWQGRGQQRRPGKARLQGQVLCQQKRKPLPPLQGQTRREEERSQEPSVHQQHSVRHEVAGHQRPDA